MIDSEPLKQFQPLTEGLLRPIYADYSFGNIPATIHYLLTGEKLGPLLPESCFGGAYPRPAKVVLFFINSLAGNSGRRARAGSRPCAGSRSWAP